MVDIRIPIGLMFSIIGILISVFGFFTKSNAEMYHKSLGINVNLIMGVMMLAAEQGSILTISAQGEDEVQAVEALIEIVQSKFGEE